MHAAVFRAMIGIAVAATAVAATGCAQSRPVVMATPYPAFVIGNFTDDYGGHHTVSATDWIQGPRTRYHIVSWNATNGYLIAQNDSANRTDAGKWTRIDWVPLPGMAPYTWAFCFSAYDAPSRDVAEATTVAKHDVPKTGCNGYPFSRLRPDAAPPPTRSLGRVTGEIGPLKGVSYVRQLSDGRLLVNETSDHRVALFSKVASSTRRKSSTDAIRVRR